MVAIKSAEADRFIAKDLTRYSAFLVFGSDVGLVSERVRFIVRAFVDDPKDPFQLVRLNGDDIAKDTGRLVDEVQTVPLFGGRRAVLVDVGSKVILPAVERALAAPLSCPLVFAAGALKWDSALLKTFERSRHAAAIESMPDDEKDLALLIDAEIAAANMTIDPDAKLLLASLLGADRLASRSEIGKLILYAQGQTKITVEDVEQAVADASVLAVDASIDAAFSSDFPGLDAAIERLSLNATEAGSLMMAALRHAIMLHRAKLGGWASLPAYVRASFSVRRKGLVERQIAIFNADTLGRIIARLGEAIGEARRDPRLAENHATRALWMVAQAARPRGSGR